MLSKRYEYDGKPIWKLNSLQNEMKKQIDLKVAQRIYQFESVSCPICNGENFETLSQKDRYGLYLNVVICKQCGLIQANPRMTKKSYEAFYNCEYTKLYRAYRGMKFFIKSIKMERTYIHCSKTTLLYSEHRLIYLFLKLVVEREVYCSISGKEDVMCKESI